MYRNMKVVYGSKVVLKNKACSKLLLKHCLFVFILVKQKEPQETLLC